MTICGHCLIFIVDPAQVPLELLAEMHIKGSVAGPCAFCFLDPDQCYRAVFRWSQFTTHRLLT